MENIDFDTLCTCMKHIHTSHSTSNFSMQSNGIEHIRQLHRTCSHHAQANAKGMEHAAVVIESDTQAIQSQSPDVLSAKHNNSRLHALSCNSIKMLKVSESQNPNALCIGVRHKHQQLHCIDHMHYVII